MTDHDLRAVILKVEHRLSVDDRRRLHFFLYNDVYYLALLKIPLDKIGKHGIIKFDLDFGPVLHNFSIDIGLY